ncbi:UNVERIFIED_CONTAM: hypothetical protein GTU68_050062 [Idotea baltica]|nr:hypothetical protein [Idotea baltica]
MSTHRNVKSSYYCVLCHIKFFNKDELREHFALCLDKHKDKFVKNICNICKTFYASDKALKQHKNLHEEFRPHPCPHCPFKYLNKTTLDAHVKNQHSPLNKFICPFCPHSSIANAYLLKHIKVHTGEAPFECPTCGNRSKTKFLLTRHMEKHGPLRERKCGKCSFVCVGLNEYLRHRRKQHGKPIVCHICKQTFKQSSTFIRHYNLHMQKKPYKCDRCLYKGTVKESLRLHQLTHTGANVQMCPECNVPCRNSRNLRRHLEHFCNNLQKRKK